MNKKSVDEADAVNRAQEQDLLKDLTVRRPQNTSETLADFIGEGNEGKKIEIDIKTIDGSGRRPYHRQTENIINNIKEEFEVADDPNKVQIICDISAAPTFL